MSNMDEMADEFQARCGFPAHDRIVRRMDNLLSPDDHHTPHESFMAVLNKRIAKLEGAP